MVAPARAQPVFFIANAGNNTVGEYNALTGATINSAFVNGQGLNEPGAVVTDGNSHLFVSNDNTQGPNSETVGQYSATTGATINATFTSLQSSPTGLALDGNNHLFVVVSAAVAEIDATTGATINPAFIDHQGLTIPAGIALDGNNHMFVTNAGNGTVGEYNASTGATINATFVSNGQGLRNPYGIVLDTLGHLFVADALNNLVGEYDATTGTTINIIAGVTDATGLALDGNNHLFVSSGNDTVSEYNATTGALINPVFINGQGLDRPDLMIFVPSVPEPGSLGLLGAAASLALFGIRRRRWRPLD